MSMHAWARRLGAVTLTAVALIAPAAAQDAGGYTGLYVFGDSLSDTGNNYLNFLGLTGPDPSSATFIPTLPYAPGGGYSLGDYSNGPTWVATFAAGLGLAGYALPSTLLNGGNYAFGGARMYTDGSGAPPPLPSNFPPSVVTQLVGYLQAAGQASPSALYVIAGGGNDVRDVATAVANGAPLPATAVAAALQYAYYAQQMVGALQAAGATHIVVWDAPDVGKTPAAGSGVGAAADAGSFIAGVFNAALDQTLAGTGATIFDIYGLVDDMVANPAKYGYTNVTQACGYAANGCDPATALFWDGIHPTAYAQGIVGNAMLASVPEPASVLMLSAGLALLSARRRRRR